MPDPKRIKDLTPEDPARVDEVMFSDSSGNVDRKTTLQNLISKVLGVGASTVAGLPSASPARKLLLVTDGRKVGELAGAGSGVLCQSDGTNWKTCDDGSTVAS